MNPFNPIESEIEPGLSVIEASAGTGKTFSISHLVPRLLLKNPELRISEILLVTYTNDAAGELADRTRKVFAHLVSRNAPENETVAKLRELMNTTPRGVDKIKQSIRDLDLLSISTIHSFCQSVLQSEGELCGLPVMPEVLVDWKDLVRESLHDLWKNKIARNETLSQLSAMQGWKFDEDLQFVFQAIEMPEVRIEPNPPSLEGVLSDLANIQTLFQAADLGALQAFFAEVGTWNKAGGSETYRSSVLETLKGSNDLSTWYDAVKWVAALDESNSGAIKKSGNIHDRAAALAAVHTAKKILSDFQFFTLSWRKYCAECVSKAVSESLQANRVTTFNGMVKTLDDALKGKNSSILRDRLRERFKIALVDESQDTDPAQFRIFEKIFLDSDNHSLVLIGDPKQAIYAFRGADVNTYLAAKQRPGTRIYTLSETYRSPQPLVDCVNALFSRPLAFLKEDLDFLPSTSAMEQDAFLQDPSGNAAAPSRLEAWVVPDSAVADFSNSDKRLSAISNAVAAEICRLLNADSASTGIIEGASEKPRKLVPADFAVLVSENFQAVAVHEALKARGIPAIRKTNDDIMATDEARDLLTLLSAVNAPLQAKTRRAALATRLLGRTDEMIRAVQEEEGDATLARFQFWKLEWMRRGIASVLALIDAQEGISSRLASSPDGERRLTNFRHLTDLLSAFAAISGGKPNRLLTWLEQEIARVGKSDTPPEERVLQLESDSLAVKITTMHSAKGLEFPLVFCPFLWSPKDLKSHQVLNRSGSSCLVDTTLCEQSMRNELQKSTLEERLRLTYVALTRAKVKLWICAGAVPGKNGGASALDWVLTGNPEQDLSTWSAGASRNRGQDHIEALLEIATAENLGAHITIQEKLPPSIDEKCHSASTSLKYSVQLVDPPNTYWRTTSFSQLTREKSAKGEYSSNAEGEGADAGSSVKTNAFGSLTGGSHLGTAVHDFLEQWDFSDDLVLAYLESHFARYSLSKDQAKVPSAAAEMLAQLREAVLPRMGCKVAEACCTPKTSEWQFHLPVKKDFGVDALAAIFRKHKDEPYAQALEKLGSDPLDGFLQGFIDKIAVHGPSHGVIDWKTNKLPAYDHESLKKAARSSHYWLQTHLYLVALRRYLGKETSICGAWLVYLRAVRQGSDDGILRITPEAELIDDLDGLFVQPKS